MFFSCLKNNFLQSKFNFNLCEGRAMHIIKEAFNQSWTASLSPKLKTEYCNETQCRKPGLMNGFRYFFLLKNIFFCVFLHYFFCFVIPYIKIYSNVYINPQKSFVQRYSFKFLALDSLQHNNPQFLSVKTRDYTDRTRIMYLYSFTSLETQLCPV